QRDDGTGRTGETLGDVPDGDQRLRRCNGHRCSGVHVELGWKTIARKGVGLKPLHGLRSCGQAEMATSRSISARGWMTSPACDVGSSISSRPSGWCTTFMKGAKAPGSERLVRLHGRSAMAR